MLATAEYMSMRPIHDAYNNSGLVGSTWRYLLCCLPPDFTFLHFDVSPGAPRGATNLMKNGAAISQEVKNYPDLTPL